MDVRQLQYFLAVVDEGSVSAAAERLYVAQPSVSQSIRRLERELRADLFHRTGRRLSLTVAGESLIVPARQVLRWLGLARAHVDAVQGLRAGRLVIATMPSQAVDPLPAMINRFIDRHPMVQVSIRAAGTPPEVVNLVRSGGVEVGIAAATDAIDADGLAVHPVAEQRFIVVSSHEAQLPTRGPLTYEQLEGQRLIVGQPGTGMRQVADEVLARTRSAVAVVESEHREAILPMVLSGLGTAVISEAWRSVARESGLIVHDLECDVRLEVAVLHHPDGLSPAARAFVLAATEPQWERLGLTAGPASRRPR
ncbi:LysR family transcriptional regulator [Georgenia alba]|uniref:LysR family transcriptional regulator n=1 Tax=Georgenia alba TaxID=2233858 RepID=A0ABW2Q5W0_9MICO